ncbi:MAG: ECF transporter S component [Oscillospiraceae bacterium]|nr:ECF transporter S component [Oscillospiraceae bacterium]
MKKMNTDKLTILAMFAALAFIAAAFFRIPVVLFLRYDPKDIIITIGGFLYGPLAAFAITIVVSFVQMLTVSATGFGGFIMNVIAGSAFACTAAFIYKKKRTLTGAIIGLVTAWLLTTAVMLATNYLLAPIIMGRDVTDLLIPYFLPFNLLKGGLNAAVTILLYKHVKTIFRAARMPISDDRNQTGKINKNVVIAATLVVAICIVVWLRLQGII